MEGDGEVGDEAQLGSEVAKETGVEGKGPLGACEACHGLSEAAVLCHQQVIVVILQVESMEGELNA